MDRESCLLRASDPKFLSTFGRNPGHGGGIGATTFSWRIRANVDKGLKILLPDLQRRGDCVRVVLTMLEGRNTLRAGHVGSPCAQEAIDRAFDLEPQPFLICDLLQPESRELVDAALT